MVSWPRMATTRAVPGGDAAVVANAISEEGWSRDDCCCRLQRCRASGIGCVECDAAALVGGPAAVCGLRPHRLLRDSLARHRLRTGKRLGQPIIRSFEPGEDWFWDYSTMTTTRVPNLPHRNAVQRTDGPGPRGQYPATRLTCLHAAGDPTPSAPAEEPPHRWVSRSARALRWSWHVNFTMTGSEAKHQLHAVRMRGG